MRLVDALQELRAVHAVVLPGPRLKVWPAEAVTPAARRAISRHREQVRLMLANADCRVCASPGLHRPSWKYDQVTKMFVCELCQRLDGALGLWKQIS